MSISPVQSTDFNINELPPPHPIDFLTQPESTKFLHDPVARSLYQGVSRFHWKEPLGLERKWVKEITEIPGHFDENYLINTFPSKPLK